MTAAPKLDTSEAFAVSFIQSKFDNQPRRAVLTWEQLRSEFAIPRRTACTLATCGTGEHIEYNKDGNAVGCRHKNGPAWIPATFKSGRKKSEVEAVSLLVVDADHLPTAEALEAVLEKLAGYRFLACATHSDRDGNRCARIILPLSRSVPGGDWPRFWPAAMNMLGMPADPSCCDAGRLYYLPARPSDADYWFAAHDGEPIDVMEVVKNAPPVAPAVAASLKVDDAGIVGEGQRHAMLKSLAGAMRHRGASQPEIEAALLQANQYRCNPPKPEAEVKDLAAWAAAQPISSLPELKRSNREKNVEPEFFSESEEGSHLGTESGPKSDDDAPLQQRKRKAKGDGAVKAAAIYVRDHASHSDGVLLRRWRGDFYRWAVERGHYAPLSDDQIRAELYRKLGLGKRGDVGEVRDALVAVDDVLIDHAELGEWLDGRRDDHNPVDLAPCRNGLIHLPTRALTPATPRYFATTALGVAFEPHPALPRVWLSFLKQLWPADDESIALLQEWMGYLLTPDTRLQKILLLLGPKRSGKGTIARVIGAMLGAASVASPTLASLGTNFGLWPLIGKTAAIIGDARLGGRSDIAQVVERLLSISGEDLQTIDRKHRTPWTGKLVARITIISNEPPKFTDASDALACRMLVLELQNSFYGKEDATLTDKLLAELPGILRWAIDGWKRLRDRGHFVQPAASRDAIEELIDLASPVAAWVRQRCVTDSTDSQWWLTGSDAYDDFKRWCEQQGHKHVTTLTTFGRDLKTATGLKRKQIRRPSLIWVYEGLALRGL